ncbi:hypothetical protein AGLY_006712 [Aphis glycines]|uniref:Lipocalin/cytosolic fatty-acid binding domain-containing protein n=1 Tax=Aphis glycines TaxID=307491 RepID=A0A6G0TSR4_APHGL|nr:hypothetical protein AGLY_006712 [Aphis glycines]
MLSQFSLFSVILILLGGRCFYGINGEEQQQQQQQPEQSNTGEITDIAGRWYAVMATPCSDGGECNLLTNNKVPCQCISADFLALQSAGFQVYMYAINNQTSKITVDMGGASYVPPDNKKEVQGFIYSRATMDLSVIQKTPYGLSENVYGIFYKFKMTIIGSNLEFKYMITTMSSDSCNTLLLVFNPSTEKMNKLQHHFLKIFLISKPYRFKTMLKLNHWTCKAIFNYENKVSEATVVWCRVKAPGKATIWTQIVQHFKRLNMDIHKLNFINQLNCVYPTIPQCNEIFFC